MLHTVYIYIYLIIDARFNLIYKRKIFLAISIFYDYPFDYPFLNNPNNFDP